jgi:prolyl-tRNA editing enzyme YbaK/EbsC (Cys-tRNA(Pro) deacylase)
VAKRSSGGTPAVQALRAAGVTHSLHPYAHAPRAESSGLEAAEILEIDPARVFKRSHPTVVDASALDHETVHVSGGRRVLDVQLAPEDLVRLTRARTTALTTRG